MDKSVLKKVVLVFIIIIFSLLCLVLYFFVEYNHLDNYNIGVSVTTGDG